MSTLAAPVSVEQFLALPEDVSVRRELIAGEIIEMARAGQLHEVVKAHFFRELGGYFMGNPVGLLMGETSYQLSPHDSPQPDVSVILAGRLTPGHTGLIPFAPDIAVEVVSSESAAVLQAKIKLYLRCGTKVVWVPYPELRLIHVYDASGVRELASEQRLEAPDLLPGFSVAASVFFEGL